MTNLKKLRMRMTKQDYIRRGISELLQERIEHDGHERSPCSMAAIRSLSHRTTLVKNAKEQNEGC